MSSRPLLGEFVEPDNSGELRRRIEKLERELAQQTAARQNAETRANSVERGLQNIRRQLEPLHNALAMLFGELEERGVGSELEGSVPQRTSAVWEAWKQRLGGGAAKVIDALLLHQEMNTTQLAIATGLHRTTIPGVIHKLKTAGLINKIGNDFSLKQL